MTMSESLPTRKKNYVFRFGGALNGMSYGGRNEASRATRGFPVVYWPSLSFPPTVVKLM